MTTTNVPAFWKTYGDTFSVLNLPVPHDYTSWHFCTDESSANSLARLVYEGKKTATASLLWTYEAENEQIPRAGDFSIITLWDETPVCVIQTTDVRVIPFIEVPPSFACNEGEGDRSLEYWREVHRIFFTEECLKINKNPVPDMPVVCESFKVAFRQDGLFQS
jgi:uncharacterized protein YhfF